MKPNLSNKEDIALLVQAFYGKVQRDAVLGPFFNDVAQVNWEAHMETLTTFWHTVLFGQAGYKGNPMLTHILLDKKAALQQEHFGYWLRLFTTTVDELFAGDNASTIKAKAESMAQLMWYKIESSRKPGFLA